MSRFEGSFYNHNLPDFTSGEAILNVRVFINFRHFISYRGATCSYVVVIRNVNRSLL